MSEPEEVLSIDEEESSNETAKDAVDSNDESDDDQSTEVTLEVSSESENVDNDPKEEK